MSSTIRILFVEDDQEMAATYLENFEGPNFESLSAPNGKSALDLIEKSEDPFDVVVTDNYMPEMDGITLLRKIRVNYPEMKVIIVTGYGDWEHYVNAQKLGVVKFLDKPVKMTQLKQLILSLQS